ncbi:hypothetical protein [Hymenobacter elongatus]|uniref:Uncharacterized protein n=1 Tax=Hymenobacter elongatus TaxID=877208 RepID=A0A4Z0PF81_9BACT|nr:hypothetical protein [Hymenobacter elongatus]TGE13500.1 hypothetical protein E5J99_19105 [Hymenobacter elongatus]
MPFISSHAQNAYNDCRRLDEACGTNNTKINDAYKFFRILASYYPVSEQPISFIKIYEDFAPNPYIAPELGKATQQILDSLENIATTNDQITGLYESSKGVNAKRNNTAQINRMIARTNSQAIIDVLNEVKDNINSKQASELAQLSRATDKKSIEIRETALKLSKFSELIQQRATQSNELMIKIRQEIAATGNIMPTTGLPNINEFANKWYPFRYAVDDAQAVELIAKAKDKIENLQKIEEKNPVLRKNKITKAYKAILDTFLLSSTKIYRDIAYGTMEKTAYQKQKLYEWYPIESVALHTIEAQIDALMPTIHQPIYGMQTSLTDATFFTGTMYSGLSGSNDNAHSLADPAAAAAQRTQTSIPSWQAVAIDGLSMFVAERLQAELNAAFFQRFSAILNDPRYNDIQLLFPSTSKLLTRGSNDYTSVIQLLRSAFRQDLTELMFNFTETVYSEQASSRPLRTIHRTLLLNPTANKTRLIQLRYVYLVLMSLREAARGTHPAELLSTLSGIVEQSSGLIEDKEGMQEALQRLSIFSNAIRQNSGLERGWITKDQVEELTTQERKYRFFLGLIYQQLNQLGATDPLLYDSNKLQGAVLGFCSLATQMEGQIAHLRQRATVTDSATKLRAKDYEPLYRTLLSTAEFTESKIMHRSALVLSQQRKLSDAILEGYIAAGEGRYGVTVANLLMVVTTILPPDEVLRLVEKKRGNFAQNLTAAQRQQLLAAFQSVRDSLIANRTSGKPVTSGKPAAWSTLATPLLAAETASLLSNDFDLLPLQAQYEQLHQIQEQYAVAITPLPTKPFTAEALASYKNALQAQIPAAAVKYVGELKNQYDTASINTKLSLLDTWSLDYGLAKAAVPINIPQLIRYGQFMAAVAEARKAEDVHNALKAAALPTGSSSIKRQTFVNVSLNAYAGLNAGGEWLQGSANGRLLVSKQLRGAAGFTAPIGLAISWGMSGRIEKAENTLALKTQQLSGETNPKGLSAKQRHVSRASSRLNRISRSYQYYGGNNQERYLRGTSLSAFVSLIDIAAPVQFRLNPENNTSTLPQDVTFKQILAPGIFGVYGFRNSPLSLLAGGQFNPDLRKVESSGATVEKRDAFRFSLGLTVDIPLFNIFSRTERRGTINYWQGSVQFNRNGSILNHKATHPQFQTE